MMFVDDPMLPEAEQPWLPTLLDIEYKKSQSTAPYTSFGFDKLEIAATLTNITSRKSTLNTRFIERYGHRRMNCETLERWQVRLQNRFDEIADEYERAYTIYAAQLANMNADISQGTNTTYTSSTKNINTPDAVINANDNYADAISKGSGSSSTLAKGQLIEDVNRNIYAYKDIDTEFIKEFENLFLNVFWY